MDYNGAIKLGLQKGKSHIEIARKLYLGYPTCVFIGNEERGFEITNKIANEFKVPYTSVQVVGSAKLGFSCHKENNFNPKKSDLDIAIIDKDLFINYVETSYEASKGYSDLTKFPVNEQGDSLFEQYIKYVAKGIFRPDLMPSGPEKAKWRSFFLKISTEYGAYFKSINAGIYSTVYFFESKQKMNIKSYKARKGL